MRMIILRAVMAGSLAFALAACGGAEEETAVAAPTGPEGVSVDGAWVSLPAVSGNPAAVYFTIANESDRDATIRAASVEGAASAMLHETATWNLQEDMQELFTIPVPAGESVVLEPGGIHVMAMGMEEGLEPGGSVPVTLSFAGGKSLTFDAELRAPGDAPGGETSGSEADGEE